MAFRRIGQADDDEDVDAAVRSAMSTKGVLRLTCASVGGSIKHNKAGRGLVPGSRPDAETCRG